MLIYQRFIITINQFWGQELAHSVSSIEVSKIRTGWRRLVVLQVYQMRKGFMDCIQ